MMRKRSDPWFVVTSTNSDFEPSRFRMDLALVDVVMPGPDGFALAKILLLRSTVPLPSKSARSEEIDSVLGLELAVGRRASG